MSNVIKQKEDLQILREFLINIDKKEINRTTLIEFINQIAPKKG